MIREGILNQQVRVQLAADHLPAAEAILTAEGFSFDGAPHFPGLSDGTPFTQPAGLLYVSALRFLLASARTEHIRGGKKKILTLATLVLDAALGCHLLTIAIETLLLRSQLQAVFGADESSLADVARALDLAEPEGFVSMFVEEGQPIQAALADLASLKQVGTGRKAYLQHILSAFPPANPEPVPESRSAPGAGCKNDRLVSDEAPVKPLTARELEVLKLITAGDSNQTIAEKLVITVSAVKKHSGNIFSKLSVNSRTQAVARARHLGILPPGR
jgi:LuxR family maltose regulon positive regulatory protein